MTLRRCGLLLLSLLALSACAPLRVRETPAALAELAAREALLAPKTHWALSAHIFVSDGGDQNGSGDLEWRHDGDRYSFTLRAPTGKTWKLSGDAREAVLEGVAPQPIRGRDPAQLLHEHLGWDVPVADLASWVRGMRAPRRSADVSQAGRDRPPAAVADPEVQYDERNRPALLAQDGWKIEYRDWFDDRDPPMPRKVFASRADARVKLAIERWSFDD